MKKYLVLFIFALLILNGCTRDNNYDDLLNKVEFIQQNTLNVMSLNDYNNNIIYLKGYFNSNEDIKLLNDYFNNNLTQIHLLNKDNESIAIETFKWNFRLENGIVNFDLSLYTKDKILIEQDFLQIQVTDETRNKEFDIGNYQIYCKETSSNDSIITIYSPFSFTNLPVLGEPFTIKYDIAINPKLNLNSIEFSIELPDNYEDLKIEKISSLYNEDRTKEYINSSPGISKNLDNYKNLKVYNVYITYKQIIEGNVQIQPLIIATTDKEEFKCKPITPFNILYENYDK